MRILIVSATPFEITPFEQWLQAHFIPEGTNQYKNGAFQVNLLVTGVGLIQTAYHLGIHLAQQPYNLVINAGIAGALNPDFQIGQVYNVVSEQFADLGVEEADGSFTSAFDLELINGNRPPYRENKLWNEDTSDFAFLPSARGISVNKVHGSLESISQLKSKVEADLESMEGAAFFYACKMAQVSFLEIRSISNHVEPRNKANWDIPLAINQLNEVIIQLVGAFIKRPHKP